MIQDGINAGIIWVKYQYYEMDERFIFYTDLFSDIVSMKINAGVAKFIVSAISF
jgi:hypothetical protein